MSRNHDSIFSCSIKKVVCILFLISTTVLLAQFPGKMDAIYSGTPWLGKIEKIVSAHAANIIKNKEKFYLFGEAHSDGSNAFEGFNCYSSKNLTRK